MIYVSSGGDRRRSARSFAESATSHGIRAVELSGGSFEADQLPSLKALRSRLEFQLHNYFPPPKSPFVFNLASLNEEVAKRSVDHVILAMNWASALELKYYSFHAGFLIDPRVRDLGKTLSDTPLSPRETAMSVFLERVGALSARAKSLGLTLLIENNVLSAANRRQFSINPLLMATTEECEYVMQQLSGGVKLLVDVAHLKVSAKSLNFDPIDFLTRLNPWISAYHLSDNDGLSDSNGSVAVESWFWTYLKRDLDYYSLEVYNVGFAELYNQVELAKFMLTRDLK
jgi:sugar phosphate isomerase/epimerase